MAPKSIVIKSWADLEECYTYTMPQLKYIGKILDQNSTFCLLCNFCNNLLSSIYTISVIHDVFEY